MNDELSAMVDGELNNETFGSQMKILLNSEESRAAWDTYHLIGDVMRGQMGPEICSRVAVKLAQEPTVLAPRSHASSNKSVGAWAMSLAAGAAAVAMVVWGVLPAVRGDLQVAQKAPAPQMPSAAAPAVAQVADYLLAHQRYSSTSAMQGVAPYVRTVADERESGR
jgi:sigma-E factor negative regulatory protein RseA